MKNLKCGPIYFDIVDFKFCIRSTHNWILTSVTMSLSQYMFFGNHIELIITLTDQWFMGQATQIWKAQDLIYRFITISFLGGGLDFELDQKWDDITLKNFSSKNLIFELRSWQPVERKWIGIGFRCITTSYHNYIITQNYQIWHYYKRKR